MNHCGVFYDPRIPMYMNHSTYIRQSINDGHSDDNSSDKTHRSIYIQQDNAGVNNPIMPRLEENTKTIMQTCQKVSMVVDQKECGPGQVGQAAGFRGWASWKNSSRQLLTLPHECVCSLYSAMFPISVKAEKIWL